MRYEGSRGGVYMSYEGSRGVSRDINAQPPHTCTSTEEEMSVIHFKLRYVVLCLMSTHLLWYTFVMSCMQRVAPIVMSGAAPI